MLNKMLKAINQLIEDNFKVKVEKSSLTIYDTENWEFFCKKNDFKIAEGIYIPRNLSAHVLKSKYFLQNIFHEFFGHGLFIEHTDEGKQIHSLEQKLMQEESYLKTKEEIINFRESNENLKNLKEMYSENLQRYESFAINIEYQLSKITNTEKLFEEKYLSACVSLSF